MTEIHCWVLQLLLETWSGSINSYLLIYLFVFNSVSGNSMAVTDLFFFYFDLQN